MKKLCRASASLLVLLLFHSSAFAQAFFCSNTPRAIAVGDFNSGGKLDIAVVQQGSNSVFIHLGDGHGGLQAPVKIATGFPTNKVTSAQPTSVVAGDFTNGGKVDLAVAGFRNVGTAGDRRLALSILKGDGSEGFATSQFIDLGSIPFLGGTFPTLVVGDLNGDGKQDLALVDGQTTVSIFLQNSGGGFPISPSFSTDLGGLLKPADVAVGDFNRDGKEDFAVAMRLNSIGSAPSDHVALFLGNGTGGFTRQPDIKTGESGPQSIVAGDFNGDGNLDLAVLHFNSNDISIFLGNGSGGLSLASTILLPAGQNGASLVALDFNGDGNLDLAAATTGPSQDDNKVFVLLGNGNGNFPTSLVFNFGDIGFPPRSIAAGDFNGDGRPDLSANFFCLQGVKILLNPLPPPDTIPPATIATASPGPNANGWNNADVTVNFSATDNAGGSGVKEIVFSLSGAQTGGNTVAGNSASVTISAEGVTTITYFARDIAGNQETAKTLTVRIDKTAPELAARCAPPGQSPLVVGIDSISGIASITLTESVPFNLHEFKRKDTFTVLDQAGNRLKAIFGVKAEGHELRFTLLSLTYNGGSPLTLPENEVKCEWAFEKSGALKELEQKLEIRPHVADVQAKFRGDRNETEIRVHRPEPEVRVTRPGVVFLRLTTHQGHLGFDF